jgi:hypothetical protein
MMADVSDVCAVLSARFQEIRAKARRAGRDDLLPERSSVIANVRQLYELRQAVDDAIDAEVERAREMRVSFDLLGTTRQQAQQRHKRAMARKAIAHDPA